jgi:mono/diheme cytochrome c family protein
MNTKFALTFSLAGSIAALFLLRPDFASSQVQFGAAKPPPPGFIASDPGVRGDPAGAGGPIAGLVGTQGQLFADGLDAFSDEDVVAEGLGPRMNLDSCAGCHAQPAVGGTSPFVNPQVDFASKDGGTDTVPTFVSLSGPVREARFVKNPDKSPDGGVHALFTITGRAGATGCALTQPDFATQLANGNVIFRIPTPTFGAGLIEQIPDSAIIANAAASAAQKAALGIKGKPNITGTTNNNGNDGTIARFGWKAQNKSLLLFSGEAYNVEQGISNELFQTERDETANCQFATTPNDATKSDPAIADPRSDVERFAMFMRLLAPPAPAPDTPSIINGRALFSSTGCALCHTPSLTTGPSTVAALGGQTANLYSDLVVHDMGDGLADGVSQGAAGPREFRSAPLWGLGQRIFFLHDGRTSDLVRAIQEHSSKGSEANDVISRYNDLPETDKQDLLNFLRAL